MNLRSGRDTGEINLEYAMQYGVLEETTVDEGVSQVIVPFIGACYPSNSVGRWAEREYATLRPGRR